MSKTGEEGVYVIACDKGLFIVKATNDNQLSHVNTLLSG
jgi:hypothetical protein